MRSSATKNKSSHSTKTLTLANVGLAKVGLAKVGSAKVGSAKVGSAKVGLAKVDCLWMAKVAFDPRGRHHVVARIGLARTGDFNPWDTCGLTYFL